MQKHDSYSSYVWVNQQYQRGKLLWRRRVKTEINLCWFMTDRRGVERYYFSTRHNFFFWRKSRERPRCFAHLCKPSHHPPLCVQTPRSPNVFGIILPPQIMSEKVINVPLASVNEKSILGFPPKWCLTYNNGVRNLHKWRNQNSLCWEQSCDLDS